MRIKKEEKIEKKSDFEIFKEKVLEFIYGIILSKINHWIKRGKLIMNFLNFIGII